MNPSIDHFDISLAFTGERFVPDAPLVGHDTRLEHLLRYQAVVSLASGKCVLDAACGEGYGANLLAASAKYVTGIDLSSEVIYHARQTYASARNNLRFDCGAVTSLTYPDESFDLVVSFETIEHIGAAEQQLFVREIYRVLKPDGILIISTPNRINYSERTRHINKFHIKELTPNELLELLLSFKLHRLYSQSTMAFSSIWETTASTYQFHGQFVPHEADDSFVIAVCGRDDSVAPQASLSSLSYNADLSYNQLRITLAEKEAHIDRLSSWGKQVDEDIKMRDKRIYELQNEVERLVKWGQTGDHKINDLSSTLAEKEAHIDRLSSWGKQVDEDIKMRDKRIYELQNEVERLVKWANSMDREILDLKSDRAQMITDAEGQISARDLRIAQLQTEVESLGPWGHSLEVKINHLQTELAAEKCARESEQNKHQHTLSRLDEMTKKHVQTEQRLTRIAERLWIFPNFVKRKLMR